ncbi:hypothetical protein [Imperialibacter sp.]|uniref:hypothetical protein n=1 Tax=Imperialibacter sp. TaxID=2038411 RepID=UPI0032EBA495
MGFGFNLFFILILVPLTGILLIVWLISRKLIVGKILGLIWLGIFGLGTLVTILNWLTSKTELDKDDYYGEYVINRDYFKGEQTDWQYDHFRFKITDNDSIFFYVTDKEKILKTYRGTIKTTDPRNYNSARLIIEMEEPTHHILASNPTTYRSAWDFYLVFKSPKFYNVFFEKGKWEPIE